MSRKPKTINFWQGQLPHWEVEEGRYFVTLHLAGAIPTQAHARIQSMAAEHDKLTNRDAASRLNLHRRIFSEMETWLDVADRNTSLGRPEVADMVVEAIKHRENRVWHMFEFVVMPTHIHMFFELRREGLKEALEEFKRWTGHQASKLKALNDQRFWQDEWFDHWSRSDEEDDRIIAYIRRNPVKAGLVGQYQDWPYGSWSR